MSAKAGHEFEAEFQARQGNATRRARVRFDVRGLVITSDDRAEPHIWPYATLATPGAVAEGGPVHVTSTADPGAMLRVRDGLFIRSLAQAVPGLAGSRPHRGPASTGMVVSILLSLAIIAGLVYAAIAFLPYKTMARWIPDGTRETLGSLAKASLTKGRRTCDAPSGKAALDTLVKRLTGSLPPDRDGKRINFKVTVVDWDLVNAFAVMGNQVVLTKALIGTASSADEVAGVLGHEMGHSIEMHPEAGVLRAVGTVAAIKILLGGWSPDIMTEMGAQVVLLRYSRSAETEADEVALKLLRDSKIAATGFAAFFERLASKERKGSSPSVPDIFSTHPSTPERAKRAASQPSYPATPALTDAEWTALRNICGT